jgi:hypothetical protein
VGTRFRAAAVEDQRLAVQGDGEKRRVANFGVEAAELRVRKREAASLPQLTIVVAR